MDLFDAPFNRLHELYYYTYSIREEREKIRKKEEDERKKKDEIEAKKNKKHKPITFDRRLSPAAQAQEAKHMKSQRDEKNKSEAIKTEPAPTSNFDTEDLLEALEEGV